MVDACLMAMPLVAAMAFFLGLAWGRRQTAAERVIDRAARRIVEGMPAHGWSNDPDGSFTYVTPSLAHYFGMTESDFDLKRAGTAGFFGAQKNLEAMVVHPDDVERTAKAWRSALQSGKSFINEHRLRRADGQYRWYRVHAAPSFNAEGKILAWYGTETDIEDLKQVEFALRQREQELQLLIDTIPAEIWCIDAKGKPSYFNKRLRDFTGRDPDEFEGAEIDPLEESNRQMHHPDDYDILDGTLRHCLASGEPFLLRYRLRRADGTFRWTDGRAAALRDANGEIVQWYGICLDIDDLIQTEETLRQRERQLQQLIDTVPAQIWCIDPAGQPSYFNKRLRDYLGRTPIDYDEAGCTRASRVNRALVHPEDLPEVEAALAHSYRTGEPFALRYRQQGADTVFRWTEGRAEALRDTEGNILQWYGVCHDVDDLVRATEELRHAQEKLARAAQSASLAELSASIAHEVNQPLAAIVANSQACLRWLATDPPNLDRARITTERVIRDANGAAEIVARVRALFKQTSEGRNLEDINKLIEDVVRLHTEEAMRSGLMLSADLASYLPSVRIDRIQLQQVLINLVRNACEALATSEMPLGSILLRSRQGLDEVLVEVSDNGPGLSQPDKAFEPFFTTKSGGIGMGLAICRSIVQSHDGRLWATANRDGGTTFTFSLPLDQAART